MEKASSSSQNNDLCFFPVDKESFELLELEDVPLPALCVCVSMSVSCNGSWRKRMWGAVFLEECGTSMQPVYKAFMCLDTECMHAALAQHACTAHEMHF